MGGHVPERDRADVEALAADRYLDALLAGAPPTNERRSGPAGAADRNPVRDTDLDPAVREAAGILRRSLIRVHPSFRFEEALAARLGAMARATSDGTGWGELIPFGRGATSFGRGTATGRPLPQPAAVAPVPDGVTGPDPWLAAILAGALDPASDELLQATDSRFGSARRPLLIGGAITSAALSLAGVAWVAWRVARPSGIGPSPIGEIEGTA